MWWYLLSYVSLLLFLGFFILCGRHSLREEDPFLFKCLVILILLNITIVLQHFISVYLIYISPHTDLKLESAHDTAEDLLECAQFRLPSLTTQWEQIGKCLNSVDIYNVSKGRVPYLRPIPTAFVLPKLDKKSVFVTSYYQSLTTVEKALVLIHECAHIGFNAVDHAYIWQNEYHLLTAKQHYENADSFMDAVLFHCV